MAVFQNVNLELTVTDGPKMPRFERRLTMLEADDGGEGFRRYLPGTVHWLIDDVEVTESEFRSHPQSPLPFPDA